MPRPMLSWRFVLAIPGGQVVLMPAVRAEGRAEAHEVER